MSIFPLFLALASAQEPVADGVRDGRAIDLQQAMALGMPRLHAPFTDCQCVGMTWRKGDESLLLEVPATEISLVRHAVMEDGPDELSLVLSSGEELLLEQAPCRYVEVDAIKYSQILGVTQRTLDVTGADVVDACGPSVADLEMEKMAEMRERAMAAEKEQQQRKGDRERARLEFVSGKGEPQVVLGVRSTLNEAAMGAGNCFGRAPVPADTRVSVTVATKGAEVRVKTQSIGIAAVDSCFEELGQQVQFPAGRSKVRAAYVRQGN